MNEEEFGSDSESDDSDFCPANEKLAKSDSDSIDDKDEAIRDVDDDESSKKKRKTKKSHAKSAFVKLVTPVRDLEAEKRKEDALWAEFLGESDTPAKPDTSTTSSTSSYKKHIPKEQKSSAPKPQQEEEVSNVFDFAGEEVVVPKSSTNTSSESPTAAAVASTAGIKRTGTTGGLSSVLNQISKKNKLSILQKTKIDWDGFKTNEGINEDIATHNRGRDG